MSVSSPPIGTAGHRRRGVIGRVRRTWWVRYIASRLAQGLIVILGAVTISFLLVGASGDVVEATTAPTATPQEIQQRKHELGLDRPVLERYVENVTNIAQGDFGREYRSGRPAIDLVMTALPNTVALVLAAVVFAWPIALAVAFMSVLKRGTLRDRIVRRGLIALQGIPEFWFGLILVVVFSINLQWFPSFGFNRGLWSLVLPAIALGTPLIPTLVRLIRGQLLDFMALDLATALRAKGISDRRIVVAHGLRNVLVPTISFLTMQLGLLLGGTLIVEAVFGWPGIGQLLLSSIAGRELEVVQAIVVVIACVFVALSLVADLIAFAIDPRIRRGAS